MVLFLLGFLLLRHEDPVFLISLLFFLSLFDLHCYSFLFMADLGDVFVPFLDDLCSSFPLEFVYLAHLKLSSFILPEELLEFNFLSLPFCLLFDFLFHLFFFELPLFFFKFFTFFFDEFSLGFYFCEDEFLLF